MLKMIINETGHRRIKIEDSMNRLYDAKSCYQVICQKLLKSFKSALKVPRHLGLLTFVACGCI